MAMRVLVDPAVQENVRRGAPEAVPSRVRLYYTLGEIEQLLNTPGCDPVALTDCLRKEGDLVRVEGDARALEDAGLVAEGEMVARCLRMMDAEGVRSLEVD